MKKYDVILIGAGPGGIFSAYELCHKKPGLKIAVFERGGELETRKCPIDGKKITGCVHCPTCAIMNGFGGAGAFTVVTENTNGIVTVNGHSYEDPAKQTENTNFALLASKHFTEPFKDSNGYGVTHSLSHASASGVYAARYIMEKL